MKPLSYTQISLYLQCPLSYKLQYIERLQPAEKWYFSFGNTLHSCAEFFFRVNIPPPPSLEELLAFYDRNWLSEGYENPEEEERYRNYGKDILTRFWEIHYPDFRMPVAVERSFTLDVDGIKVRGFIDRVDKLDSGGLSIIDYKSNKDLFTTDYVVDDLQLTIYQMAAEQTWQLPVEMLTLYHLRTNTPCSCPPREPERITEARNLVLQVAEGIAAGDFPATEHRYCPCDFPQYCPYRRHQFLREERPQEPQQVQLPGLAAIDAAERYAELQAEIKGLQAELEETRKMLIDYCQAEDLNRVYGNTCEITYRMMERTGFNEEEVRTILEPEGLWEKVLSLDPSRLNKLLVDKSLDSTLKERIKALRRITSTYPQLWLKKHDRDSDEEMEE